MGCAPKLFAPGRRRILLAAILGAMAWSYPLTAETPDPEPAQVYHLSAERLAVVIEVNAPAELPRFDETASVTSVTWCDRPYLGGAGLVDEFGLEGIGVLGYSEAAVGKSFLKIGVGALQRDTTGPYRFQHAYPRLKKFPVEVSAAESELTVQQESGIMGGYGYRYRKHYQLDHDGALTIRYLLSNTGERAFVFEHYNHNFFALARDGKAGGDGYVVETAFPLSAPVAGWILETPRQARLLPPAQSVAGPIFWRLPVSIGVASHRIVLAHPNGSRVVLTGDTPLVRFCLWTDRSTMSPETFSQDTLAPGQTAQWVRRYRFEIAPSVHASGQAGTARRVHFTSSLGLHATDERPLGFEAAGEDRRYAWRNATKANLHNRAGLPMEPFRSDRW